MSSRLNPPICQPYSHSHHPPQVPVPVVLGCSLMFRVRNSVLQCKKRRVHTEIDYVFFRGFDFIYYLILNKVIWALRFVKYLKNKKRTVPVFVSQEQPTGTLQFLCRIVTGTKSLKHNIVLANKLVLWQKRFLITLFPNIIPSRQGR